MNKFTFVFFAIAFPLFVIAQNPAKIKWTVKNPFEQKVFIENKGQYELQGKLDKKEILFGARVGGLQYYFTKHSIWIEKQTLIKQVQQDSSIPKMQDDFHEMEFTGANPLAQITAECKVKWYYNYTLNKTIPIKAGAYKKLVYNNLYPGIDMEFYFRDDTTGFEYSFIVHPGADISQIKIEYPLNQGLHLQGRGKLSVTSEYGEFIDHSPIANQNGKSVNCSFLLNRQGVGFKIAGYDKTQELVIDPWTVTPTFAGENNGLDVDWDNAGNCYIYGGGWGVRNYYYGGDPWQVIKYDTSGTMLWSYSTATSFSSTTIYLGDFAVDRTSQSVYIVEGYNGSGAEMVKLNSAGTQIAYNAGNPSLTKMWRVAFSRCAEVGVIAGGNNATSSPFNQAATLDTTLSTLSPVNILGTSSGYNDVWGLALDDKGNNCFTATVKSIFGNNNSYANRLIESPLSALTPATWTVKDGYDFFIVATTFYGFGNNGNATQPNGYNGMAYADNDLYTYDSHELKKWNASTGGLLNTVNVDGVTSTTIDSAFWGGLTTDVCNHIFLGDKSNIDQYDSDLNLVTTIAASDTVFDVKLGNNDVLYVTGINFVSAFNVSLPNCGSAITFTNTIDTSSCSSAGKVTVNINGGTLPYAVSWSNGVSGITDTNLYNGTFIAKIQDNSCQVQTLYDTVIINKSVSNKTNVSVNSSAICIGDTAVLNAIGADSYKWFPATGLSATTGSSVVANPTTTTTYVVTGTNTTTGCSAQALAIVTIKVKPIVRVLPDTASFCAGLSVTLLASGATTFQWQPATGLNTTSGDIIIAKPTSSTTYSIIGQINGCSDTIAVPVTVNPLPNLQVLPDSPKVCKGDSLFLQVKGADYFSWYPTSGLKYRTPYGDSVIFDSTVTSTYYFKGETNLGCFDSIAVTVKVVNSIPIQITPVSPTICSGQNIVLTANGASTYQWFPSSALKDTVGSSVVANPSITTTYNVIGSIPGCADSASTVVKVKPSPVVQVSPDSSAICSGQDIVIIASGATTYKWNPSTGLNSTTGDSVIATPTVSSTYYVAGAGSNGCTDTVPAEVTVIPKPTITVKGDTLISISASGNQWYRNDTLIVGATGQDYITHGQKGWYTVDVTNSGAGCTSVSDSVSGINQVSLINTIHIFPNPFNGTIFIQIGIQNGSLNFWSMQVTDVLGRELYKTSALNYLNEVDLSNLPPAMYFISITNGNENAVFKVVKQ